MTDYDQDSASDRHELGACSYTEQTYTTTAGAASSKMPWTNWVTLNYNGTNVKQVKLNCTGNVTVDCGIYGTLKHNVSSTGGAAASFLHEFVFIAKTTTPGGDYFMKFEVADNADGEWYRSQNRHTIWFKIRNSYFVQVSRTDDNISISGNNGHSLAFGNTYHFESAVSIENPDLSHSSHTEGTLAENYHVREYSGTPTWSRWGGTGDGETLYLQATIEHEISDLYKYVVNFSGGRLSSSLTGEYPDTVTTTTGYPSYKLDLSTLDHPVREGSTFSGWSTKDLQSEGELSEITLSYGQTTLYPCFKPSDWQRDDVFVYMIENGVGKWKSKKDSYVWDSTTKAWVRE